MNCDPSSRYQQRAIGGFWTRLTFVLAASLCLGLPPSAFGQFLPGTLLNITDDTTIKIQGGVFDITSADESIKASVDHKGGNINIKAGSQIMIRRNGGLLANAGFSKGLIEVEEKFGINEVEVYRLIVYKNGTPTVKDIQIAGKSAKDAKYYYDGKNFVALDWPVLIADIVINKSYYNFTRLIYVGVGLVIAAVLGGGWVIVKKRQTRLGHGDTGVPPATRPQIPSQP